MPVDELDAAPRTPDATVAPVSAPERSRLADISSAARHLVNVTVLYAAMSLPENLIRADGLKANPDKPAAVQTSTAVPGLSEEATKAEAALPVIVKKLDDNRWLTREEGQNELHESLVRIMQETNPVSPATLKIFRDLYPKAKRGELTPEQVSRLRRGERRFEQTAYEMPNTLPPRIYDAEECVNAVRRQSGFDITLAPMLQERLHGQKLDVEAWNNSTSVTIKRLCDLVDGIPEFEDGNRTSLRIVPKTKEKAGTILTSPKALALLSRVEGAGTRIDVRYAPNAGALVALNKIKGGIGGTVRIGECYIPKSGPGLPSEMTMTGGDVEHGIRIDGTIARFPGEMRCRFNDAKKHRLGFQTFGFGKSSLGDKWMIVVDVGMYAEIPWPPTPYTWDQRSYAATSATRYELKDAKGDSIPHVLTFGNINMRDMRLELECDREPETIDVRGFKDFLASDMIIFDVPHEEAKKE